MKGKTVVCFVQWTSNCLGEKNQEGLQTDKKQRHCNFKVAKMFSYIHTQSEIIKKHQ